METPPDKSGAHQFSLRKLLSWIAVCAVYLSVLRLIEANVSVLLFVTACLAVILIARVWWRMKGGMIAVLVLSLYCPYSFIRWRAVSESPAEGIAGAAEGIAVAIVIWLFASGHGLIALLLADLMVRLVDWIDAIGRKQ